MYTLKAFADEHGHRMWHDRHLMNSLRMIKKVSTFRDFATRPITEYKPTDIEALMDSLARRGPKGWDHQSVPVGHIVGIQRSCTQRGSNPRPQCPLEERKQGPPTLLHGQRGQGHHRFPKDITGPLDG